MGENAEFTCLQIVYAFYSTTVSHDHHGGQVLPV